MERVLPNRDRKGARRMLAPLKMLGPLVAHALLRAVFALLRTPF
jgi:hypothetical protein